MSDDIRPDSIVWESPFLHAKEAYPVNAAGVDSSVEMSDGGFLSIINLRGREDNPDFVSAIKKALSLALPTEPNHYEYDEKTAQSLSWLSPTEWLLVGSVDQHAERLTALQKALESVDAAVTDVSHGYGCIMLSGKHVRQCLAQGTPLDLSPRQFGAGQCAQTVLAKSDVFIWAESDEQLGLLVRRSYADYIWQWLVAATQTNAKTDRVFSAS